MALVKVSSLRVRVDVKISRDRGKGLSNASTPVTVNFNKTFADITNLDATPISNTGEKLFRVIDFEDVPDPTSFDITIINSAGTQVAREFSWEASGVLKTA